MSLLWLNHHRTAVRTIWLDPRRRRVYGWVSTHETVVGGLKSSALRGGYRPRKQRLDDYGEKTLHEDAKIIFYLPPLWRHHLLLRRPKRHKTIAGETRFFRSRLSVFNFRDSPFRPSAVIFIYKIQYIHSPCRRWSFLHHSPKKSPNLSLLGCSGLRPPGQNWRCTRIVYATVLGHNPLFAWKNTPT
jgi:hypothetical protein